MQQQQKKTVCPLDCPDACGVVATVQDNQITGIEGDPDHPFTQGFLCRKVRSYHERVMSDDRVLYPQKRVGAKGAGKFERISWDEAWDILVGRLARIRDSYGGEALLPYSYAGNMGRVNFHAGDAFFHRYGASQLNRTICSAAARAGWFMHYGNHPNSNPESATDADLVVAWGCNIKVTNIHFMPYVVEARRRGARFIVIDPYENITARAADTHYRVAPGGDTSLALGILKVLLEQGQTDVDFVKAHTSGFGELQDYLAAHNLADLIEKSGLSEDLVRALAGEFADHPRAFVRVGVGLSRNTQGAMSLRAIACLSAALGLFDGQIGRGALFSSNAFPVSHRTLSFSAYQKEPAPRMVNMVRLGEALTRLTPPVRALLVYSSNPLSVAPDASQVRDGLKREDLFTVVHEQVMTPTARYADLLLPATTAFENEDIYTGYGHFYLSRTSPVIEPRGEAISNFTLFQTLARKMGFNDEAFEDTEADRINRYTPGIHGLPDAVRSGIPSGTVIASDYQQSAGDFSQYGTSRFRFSVASADPGVPTIPQLLPNTEFDDAALQQRFPYQLIAPPNGDLLNSTFGERHPQEIGEVLIHPEDAAREGISTRDRVVLANDRGKHRRRARVTAQTQIGLLVAEGIYWEDDEFQTGINDLTSQAITDLGEGGTFHESRVRLLRDSGVR
jgi:anaerobic selenocysteine-containing dehydrogenase